MRYMKNLGMFFCTIILVFMLGGVTEAATYTFQPTPADLYDLDHSSYYTWGIDWDIPAGEIIVSASLFFDNIHNGWSSFEDLWVHLLDSATAGVASGYDNKGGGDNFSGQGILLHHWDNLPASPQDITYNFDPFEIATLNTYLTDGNFGLGFDPDSLCPFTHYYYNDGITLTVETVPIPPTILLLGSGLLGFGLLSRRKKVNT